MDDENSAPDEPGTDNPLYEDLAAVQHRIWAHWMRYLLGTKATLAEDGESAVLFARDVGHWWRQIETPYAELTEAEKASDREQVDLFWPHIAKLISTRILVIKTVERRKKALADALGLSESIPFPRLIEAVTSPTGDEEQQARQRGKVYAALTDQKVVRGSVLGGRRALDAPEMEQIAAIAVAALQESS